MLQSLRVRNLAIVEDIQVRFERGLNVITGETGAGKSIIVGALGLVLGERADRDMIRSGEETCSVEAAFQIPDAKALDAALQDLGMDPCDDGLLIVRRTMSAAGSNRNFINDRPATLQALKRIGDLLVDMHGPHDHQSLLSPDFQRDLLDSFGNLGKIRRSYEEAYREMMDIERARRELDSDDQAVAQQVDMLAFQVKELEAVDLASLDEQELEQEHTTVANAARILELSDGVRNALTESEGSAFNSAAAARTHISELARILPEAAEWLKEAESIAVQLQELSASVNTRVQDIEGDPARLQWLEDRKALLHKLKRKYAPTVPELVQFLDRAKQRLRELETRGERIAQLETQLAAAREKVLAAGKVLTRDRRKAARKLAEAITRELRDLGFPHGSFDVKVDAGEPRPSGLDEIEFGFAPNVGEPARPLRAIASSGEISRVMLATKTVLAEHDRIPVLIFDEIDSNVGGEMGLAIGTKLGVLGKDHQVLCITHLPQAAVHGTIHFVVSKDVRDGRTRTRIQPVEADARVEEIARMLGGKGLTSVTLRHAKEMLERKK